MICEIMRANEEQPGKDALFAVLKCFPFETAKLQATFSAYQTLDDMRQTSDTKIRSSGFVVHTLEAALWAFFSTENFKDGAIKVVNLGDDADTVGAVYGGLAGAYYGIGAMPTEWIEALQARDVIDKVVEAVVELVSNQGDP